MLTTRCDEGVGEQRSARRLDGLDEMSSSVSDARSRTSRLSSSYYALIAWLGVVTAALLTVTAVTVCRRARRAAAATQSVDVLSVSTDCSTSRAANIDRVERCLDVTSPHADDVTSQVNSDVTTTVGS